MAKREPDLAFDVNEALWRRIEKGDVDPSDPGRVKPHKRNDFRSG